MKITANFRVFVIPSIIILVAGLAMGIILGPNFGIDFTGGSIFTIDMGQEFEVADVSSALESQGLLNVPVVKSGASASERTQAVMRMRSFGDDQQENTVRQNVIEELKTKYPNVSIGELERVGAIASSDLIRNAILSILIAVVFMLVYIWIRFEFISGVAAVLALLHDIFIMVAIIVIFRLQVNSSFIAAVLTILGYSINNTIVIFDRIRENLGGVNPKQWTAEAVDAGILSTLARSVNTSVTTLITICALYILGVDSIKEFALPIIVGLVAGTYSSVFLAAPTWYKLQMRRGSKNSGNMRKKKA